MREDERLLVTVADNGVGLPADFDLDATTSLGLQIVRTLVVSELGGRLRISPRPGGGTEAVLDLPVAHDPEQASTEQTSTEQASTEQVDTAQADTEQARSESDQPG